MSFRSLVVHHVESVARTMMEELAIRGHESVWAFDPAEGLKCHLDSSFDLIFLGIDAPGIDAVKVIKKLLLTGSGRAPVIVVVSWEMREDLAELLDAGAADFIQDPLNHFYFERRVQVAEGRIETLRAARREVSADEFQVELLDGLPVGAFLVTASGDLSYVNPNLASSHGYPLEDLIGRPASILFADQRLPSGSKHSALECVTRRRDGSEQLGVLSSRPFALSDGCNEQIFLLQVVAQSAIQAKSRTTVSMRVTQPDRQLPELDSTVFGLLRWTVETDEVEISPLLAARSGLDQVMSASEFLDKIQAEDSAAIFEILGEVAGGSRSSAELEMSLELGRLGTVPVIFSAWQPHTGSGEMLAAIFDLGFETEVDATSSRLASLIDLAPAAVIEFDSDGETVYTNRTAEALFELADRSGSAFLPEEHSFLIEQVGQSGERINDVESSLAGSVYSWTYLANGGRAGVTLFGFDVTQSRMAERQLIDGTLLDPVTRLPNRALFLDRMATALERFSRDETNTVGSLFIDLDRFKLINQGLGRELGNRLLIEVGRRLESCSREGWTVASFGGDEFAFLIEGFNDPSEVSLAAEQVIRALKTPIDLDGQEIYTSASIGVVFCDHKTNTSDAVLRASEMAMNRAKARGGACFEIFESEMHDRAVERLQLENELRRACRGDELVAYFQPIVDLETQHLMGFEALVRWQHPERGLIFPNSFIPAAEETGLVVPLGKIVLRQACAQLSTWQLRYPSAAHLTVSVNVSGRHFSSRELVATVRRTLRKTGLAASSLKLEVTETILMENKQVARSMLNQLQAIGVGVSLDDFGTGYSSLAYLARLPIDVIKIDRSFVTEMENDEEAFEIVRTINSLAVSLEKDVVAEGVEVRTQLERLRAIGCAYAQGYLFSRPVTAAEAELMVRDYCDKPFPIG